MADLPSRLWAIEYERIVSSETHPTLMTCDGLGLPAREGRQGDAIDVRWIALANSYRWAAPGWP
jgi:hypothetical protein